MTDILPIGIDLGTTNSVIVQLTEDGVPLVISNAEGDSITPSVVWIGEQGVVVGADAKEQMSEGNLDTAAFFKRHMGECDTTFFLQGRQYAPTELSTFVLLKLKRDAEAKLKRQITHAVITVPAYFGDPHRNATIEAGRQAGLDVLELINEPTAAAFAYGRHETGQEETILAYDLGGGTFDVTLFQISPTSFRCLASVGDHKLGGKDWDEVLMMMMVEQFRDQCGIDPLETGATRRELLTLAESAKKKLSSLMSTTVNFAHGEHRLRFELSREQFEQRSEFLMQATRHLCDKVVQETRVEVLRDVGFGWDKLTGVLPVGGSTRMPMVAKLLAQLTGREPLTGINPDHAVAIGAAIRAARCLDDRSVQKRRYKLPGPQVFRDVITHPLGMVAESEDGSRYLNSIIINKYLEIPCSQTRPYQLHTAAGQNELEVYLTQGESADLADATVIGRWRCEAIEPGPHEIEVIDVEYAYTQNSTVDVAATMRSTGRRLRLIKETDLGDLSWMFGPPGRRRGGQHVTAYLAVDLSGSMMGEGVETATRAALDFVRQSDLSNCSIGLVEFADQIKTTCPACQDARQLEGAIANLKPHVLSSSVGGGNMATPFAHAHRLLKDANGAKFIIVLTDGVWSCERQAIQEAEQCRKDNLEIIAVGTEYAKHEFLRQIASSEANSFYVKQHQVEGVFHSIARELTETAGGLQRHLRSK